MVNLHGFKHLDTLLVPRVSDGKGVWDCEAASRELIAYSRVVRNQTCQFHAVDMRPSGRILLRWCVINKLVDEA